MEPRIVAKPAFTVVGIKYRGRNENNEIPQLWTVFAERSHEIQGIDDRYAYGLADNMDESTGEFDYVAGLAVSGPVEIPGGMVRWDVPGQTYAVFTCTLPTLGPTYNHVYHTWLPQSGYRRGRGPDIELYDERFDPGVPDSEMDIYVPIERP